MSVSFILGAVLECGRVFERQELQTINKRFEARPWLIWSAESLRRLNLRTLWQYHQNHELPPQWYAWDFTLSWLLMENHPPVMNQIVIFNRTLEDEPPDAALKEFPWMTPLTHYPLQRKTVAEMVDFIASAGASAIVLDNDFPQHAEGDKDIAAVIHKWSTGVNGRKVPIFMVETINSGSDTRIVELGTPTRPVGVLRALRELEPTVDAEHQYLGTTCVFQDSDQVVRGLFINRNVGRQSYKSVVLKVLERLGRPIPKDLPDDVMDIDFACPPKSDLYPTRPLVYLLDPDRRTEMLSGKGSDVHLKDAIVFVGDGITDVYSTAFTSEGNNLMSGTEILAHALDTISRHSWPIRPTLLEALVYMFSVSCVVGGFWVLWKAYQLRFVTRRKLRSRMLRLVEDLCVSTLMLAGVYYGPCFIFAYTHWLVPMFVPTVAIGFATIAAIVLEREQEREEKFQVELKAAEEKLALTQDKYESEIKRREAEAKTREILIDKRRRHEFVRRINHDLNAPVSVLNWTVSELQMMELENEKAAEKVSRLVKSSDKLCELIDQLVQSYDYETVPNQANSNAIRCDLTEIVHDCVDGQLPFATMNGATLHWTRPGESMWVKVNQLELTRVIDNLIRNAVKHNPEGTAVNVGVETRDSRFIISIADNGKGIAEQHLEHIFEPGYQVEPGKKNGQGLGLDIAKTLIEGMGGEISVTSTLKKGTIFKLKIPICEDESGSEPDDAGNHRQSQPNKSNGNGTAGSTDKDQPIKTANRQLEIVSTAREDNGN